MLDINKILSKKYTLTLEDEEVSLSLIQILSLCGMHQHIKALPLNASQMSTAISDDEWLSVRLANANNQTETVAVLRQNLNEESQSKLDSLDNPFSKLPEEIIDRIMASDMLPAAARQFARTSHRHARIIKDSFWVKRFESYQDKGREHFFDLLIYNKNKAVAKRCFEMEVRKIPIAG